MLKLNIILVTATALIMIESAEKIRFIATEHPQLVYYDTKYFSYMNFTSQRYSRYDPRYYMGLNIKNLWTANNNVSVNFYFYEYLSNSYRRGFVELHFELCDLIHNNGFFGLNLKQGHFTHNCPYPPGDYHVNNLTIPSSEIPDNFPFTKGRIVCNCTAPDNHTIIYGYVDMEIKTATLRKKKEKKVL